jgi:hypothetical protein
MEPNQALIDFLHISTKCQYFIAHNVQYDAVVLAGFIDKFPDIKKRYAGHPAFNTQNWICTYNDVPYPARFRCKILSHLALDHGIEFGPNFKAHSALIDIELILKILIAGGYTLEKILAYKNDAWIYLQALVPTPWEDNGKGKEDAKAAGYSFETARGTTEPKFPKAWVKRIKSAALEEEKKIQVPFKRQILKLDDCYKK